MDRNKLTESNFCLPGSAVWERIIYIILYFILYAFIILWGGIAGWSFEGNIETGSYECIVSLQNVYYYNVLASENRPCLLESEGWMTVVGSYLISVIFIYPLYFLRKEIWQGHRFGALPEWILITLCYWLFLMLLSPQPYPGFDERLITLSAVYEIFRPFLIWQLIVTVVFWIYKSCKIILTKLTLKN